LFKRILKKGQLSWRKKNRAAMKASGAKVLGWFVDAKAQSEFEWITSTDEGKKYNQVIGQGLTQRK
jgi:hypothetical protein